VCTHGNSLWLPHQYIHICGGQDFNAILYQSSSFQITNLIFCLTGREFCILLLFRVALGGLVVSVLATGPKVRGFKPGRGRWIFKGDKNP
jgi:hypothetical protein